MLVLLMSFTSVLDEFGVSHGRAKNAALCITEGLVIAGPILKRQSPAEVTTMVSAIEAYIEASSGEKSLVSPLVRLHNEASPSEAAGEVRPLLTD